MASLCAKLLVSIAVLPLGSALTQPASPPPLEPATRQAASAEASIDKRGEKETPIYVSSEKDGVDLAVSVASILILFVGIGGVGLTLITVRAIKKQTEAIDRQAKIMAEADRPFLIVETRGDLGTEFWVKNVGKSPGQLLFFNPVLKVAYPLWQQQSQDWDMAQPPDYGIGFHEPKAEQINVAWMAPGEERLVVNFDPAFLERMDPVKRMQIETGTTGVRVYSAIKYKGMFSASIYESRFCYAWRKGVHTYLAGSPGYNLYT